MSKILIPADSADDWKQFLAEPGRQWKRGYSARSIAHCWQDADDIPLHVKSVLEQADDLAGLETLLAIPNTRSRFRGAQDRRRVMSGCWREQMVTLYPSPWRGRFQSRSG